MKISKPPLIIFQCIGLWRPLHWKSGWRTKLYNAYTCFIMMFVSTLTVSEIIELLSSTNDIEAFASNSFLALTMSGVCGKAMNMLMKRRQLTDLMNSLEKEPYRPRNTAEIAIQEKYDRLTRFNTLSYGAMTGVAATSVVVRSLQDMAQHKVTYNGWVPYDHSSSIGFWIAHLHQLLGHCVGASINVAFDTVVPSFMLHTCAQLNILKHRFHQVPKMIISEREFFTNHRDNQIEIFETKMLSECVEHHLGIFKFAKASNDIYRFMIFVQYTLSTLVLCVSIFELSRMQPFTVEFAGIFMYLACMFTQIFIFCFYGCQVTIESLAVGDAIFEIDWPSLSINSKRCLLTIMSRTLRPITFTSGGILILNLDSFNSLLKLSYSAYNVLQRSSQQ